MVEKRSSVRFEREEHQFRIRFTDESDYQNNTESIFSPVIPTADENINWLDQYTNAHRIAEENMKFMLTWLLKIPFVDLLNEVKINYIGRICVFSTENDRLRIQQFIDHAIEKHDTCYLIQAYTANTSFFGQLNTHLAKRGSTFRFESKMLDRLCDNEIPMNCGEYIFAACLIHHPSVDPFYRACALTYRGMNLNQSDLDQYVPGARILTRSFLSTSRRPEAACLFLDFITGLKRPVLCVYHITQSQTALHISDVSDFPEEEEVLIRPFAAFYVSKVVIDSFKCESGGKATQIFLDEVPSSTERWQTNNNQSDEQNLTDFYDSQGRLISINECFSRSRKKNTSLLIENDKQKIDSNYKSWNSLLEKNSKIIVEILPMLSQHEDGISRHSRYFESIKYFFTQYCLAEYSIWTQPLLEQLYEIMLTIKKLLEDKQNGKNYDANYLQVLFARVEQRSRNIDYGINFKEDEPFIIKQLEYETVLDQRRKQSDVSKSLSALNERCFDQCLSYVQTCIDLHSHIIITGIDKDNVEYLATQLNIMPLTTTEKEYLSQNCNPLMIPLQSFVTLNTIDSDVSDHIDQLSFVESKRRSLIDSVNKQSLVNDSRDLYRLLAETPLLPSSELHSSSSFLKQTKSINSITDVMNKYRWIVILGDPGSAKTTLTRWLTLQCATNFMQKYKSNDQLTARVPILVRVGEIASALDQNSSLSLIDYLCHPTWYGKSLIPMNNDNDGRFLCEYIRHGHTLIILDGLDEIPNFRQRQHIVQLIEEFLQEWTVCPVTFIAPFDKPILNDWVSPSSCSTIGNQVIITSRSVGYYMCPIAAARIPHYTLASLSLTVMNTFIDHWFFSVYSSLKISEFKSNQALTSINRLSDELKSILTSDEEVRELISNPMMLGVLCTLILLQSNESILSLGKHRICLLDTMSKFTLKSCPQTSDRRNVFLQLLIDIAIYLHEHSSSGLIEELDTKSILRRSVNHNEDIVNDFVKRIDTEVYLFVPRGLCIYGFSHLMYEEYYVCLHLLTLEENHKDDSRWECIANQFHHYVFRGARLREPLVLALSYISWQWSEIDFNSFCNCLLHKKDINQFNDLIPIGAICLLISIHDLVRLPSTEILQTILNQCIKATLTNKWFDNFPAFVEILKTAINSLPVTFVHEWMIRIAKDMITTIGELVLQMGTLPLWFDQYICDHMWNQLVSTNYRLSCCLFPVISTNDNILLPRNDLCHYMINNNIKVDQIHPLILSIIICLCGGLSRSKNAENIIDFSPEFMHRNSDYTSILIQYLHSDPQTLLNYCHHEISLQSFYPSIDLLVMCSCLEGCKDEWLTWSLIQQLQDFAIYICSIYLAKDKPNNIFRPNTEQIILLLTSLINCTDQDTSGNSLTSFIIIALSRILLIRDKDFKTINLPYEISHLIESQLNSELFILSRSSQPDQIPMVFRRLLSSQCLSTSQCIFLSAAYIIELAIDAYERWCNIVPSIFTENNIYEILTFEIAQWINTRIQIANDEECRRLSQSLFKCKTFSDNKTCQILIDWLSFIDNPNLYQFSYHAAFLLFNINSNATKICFQLLGNELDDFRRRSKELINQNIISSGHLGHEGLKSLVYISHNWTPTITLYSLESFDKSRLRLTHKYHLNSLFDLLENIENTNILRAFSFIFDPPIQVDFITRLEKCHAATEDSIVTALIIFSRTKGKWNKFEVNRGIAIVVHLLNQYTSSNKVSSAALSVFIRWKSYNYIKHIIIQNCYPESTRIHAIRWLYRKGRCKSRWQLLACITSTSSLSSSIIDAAWEGRIWSQCLCLTYDNQQPSVKTLLDYCSNDHLRVFRSLIALQSDRTDVSWIDDCGMVHRIFGEFYTEYKFETMDAVFVYTICISLINAQNNPSSTLWDTNLLLAAEYIKKREVEFFRAIQNSILGEQDFKKALYIISKQNGVRRRVAILNLLVYYGELTMETAQLFLNMCFETYYHQQNAYNLIWRLRRVSNRLVSEYLLEKLKTESLQQRYIAALLLVQLAVNDQISINTVSICIRNTINDPISANDVYLTSMLFTTNNSYMTEPYRRGRLDQALTTLLMQFTSIAGQPLTQEYKPYKHYSEFYQNSNLLFDQIRQAPHVISCRYKPKHLRKLINEDDLDDELQDFYMM